MKVRILKAVTPPGMNTMMPYSRTKKEEDLPDDIAAKYVAAGYAAAVESSPAPKGKAEK